MSEFKAFTSAELSNDEYHNPEGWCAEYVSGSSLAEMFYTSMAKWKFGQKKKTKALTFGTQSHTNFESEKLFRSTYARATPREEIEGKVITTNKDLAAYLKACGLTGTSGKTSVDLLKMLTAVQDDLKENVTFLEVNELTEQSIAFASGKELISAEDFDKCVNMRSVLMSIPEYRKSMESETAQRELSLFGVIHGVPVKVRLDMVDVEVIDGVECVVITDYKTTMSADPAKFSRDAYDKGYYLKMALQRDLFQKVYDEKRPIIVRLLAQEKEEPFQATRIRMTDDALRIGRMDYMSVIKKYERCKRLDVWPSYGDGQPDFDIEIMPWVKSRYASIFSTKS